MLPKPNSCLGCPLYGDGFGFVPDRLVEGAKVAILAQNPGSDEEAGRKLVQYVGRDKVYTPVTPQPLIGPTGYTLEHTYLPLSGLTPGEVSYCNLLKCREQVNGKHTNKLPTGERYRRAVEQCSAAHLVVPPGTRLVVAHGGPAWDYTQSGGRMDVARPISEWRGYLGTGDKLEKDDKHNQARGYQVYATLHTASLFRSPRMKQAAMADWRKIPRILDGSWPSPLPTFLQCPSETSLPELMNLLDGGWFFSQVKRVALDTEYFYDPDGVPGRSKLSVIGIGGKDGDGKWVGFQVDCRLLGDQEVVDFIVYGLAPHVFNSLPVVFQNAGADIPVLSWNAEGRIGFDSFRIIEDLLLLHANLYSEQPHDLGYIASVAGILAQTKHFLKTDLLLRNLGDVVETLVAFEKYEAEALLDKALYKCYRDMIGLVPIHTRATEVGLKVNKEMVTRLLREEIGALQEALKIGRAYAGWPLNLGSCGPRGHLATMLYKKMGLPCQRARVTKEVTVDAGALAVLRRKVGPVPDAEGEAKEGLSIPQAMERIEEGANPLLEARTCYAATLQEISHYLAPLLI